MNDDLVFIPDDSKAAVSNELQNDDFAAQANLAKRMTNPKLSALRAQNPFLQIVAFPNSVINVLLAASVAVDINLPEGTKYISLRSTGEYFMSRNGNAQIPLAAADSQSGSTSFDPSVFVYVEELKQFSIISSSANNAVCINCYQQL